jgi:predicted PurR-regulated permease PerM
MGRVQTERDIFHSVGRIAPGSNGGIDAFDGSGAGTVLRASFNRSLLAAALQIIPHLGPVLGLVGPVLAALLHWQDWEHPFYVLVLYAVIVFVDGFLLQPYIMRRVAKVPMWASILVPVLMGFAIPFWGFVLAPPLLAVIYAYKARGPA